MDITPDNPGQGGGYQDALVGILNASAANDLERCECGSARIAAAGNAQQPQQPAPQQAEPPHHSGIVNILRAVGDALGGGSTMKAC